jgi:pathogenesis-related protein 1
MSGQAQGESLLLGLVTGAAAFATLLAGCALVTTQRGDNAGDSGVVASVNAPVPDREGAGTTDANGASDASTALDNEGAAAAGGSDATEEDSSAAFDGGNRPLADAGGGPPTDSSVHDDGGNSTIDGAAPANESAWLVPMNQTRTNVNEAPLVWDPVAAQVALTYANQCNYMHNLNAGAQYMALGGKSRLGEDIAAGAPTESIAAAVNSWVGEVADYNHATNTCAAGKVCGHYTQIVWSTTTGVGCAQVSCTTNSPFGAFASGKWQFEVCDFSPAGNIVGRAPY